MRLTSKTAIITGAGSGIGRAAALLFASEGAAVCVADRDAERASSVAEKILAAGGKAYATKTDVGNFAQVSAMIAAAHQKWGRIDVLVNNAGYGIAGTVVDTEEADWNALMADRPG